jgi:hypothetical protein
MYTPWTISARPWEPTPRVREPDRPDNPGNCWGWRQRLRWWYAGRGLESLRSLDDRWDMLHDQLQPLPTADALDVMTRQRPTFFGLHPAPTGNSLQTSSQLSELRAFLAGLFFRAGLASIFLTNAAVAWLRPADFFPLIAHTPLRLLGSPDLLVALIALNDGLLGLLLLVKPSKPCYLWAAGWLLAVAVGKLWSLSLG